MPDCRVFNITAGNVAISDVTIQYGNPLNIDRGGIQNSGGTLTIKT